MRASVHFNHKEIQSFFSFHFHSKEFIAALKCFNSKCLTVSSHVHFFTLRWQKDEAPSAVSSQINGELVTSVSVINMFRLNPQSGPLSSELEFSYQLKNHGFFSQ